MKTLAIFLLFILNISLEENLCVNINKLCNFINNNYGKDIVENDIVGLKKNRFFHPDARYGLNKKNTFTSKVNLFGELDGEIIQNNNGLQYLCSFPYNVKKEKELISSIIECIKDKQFWKITRYKKNSLLYMSNIKTDLQIILIKDSHSEKFVFCITRP